MKYDGEVNYATDPYGYPAQKRGRGGLLGLGLAVVGIIAFAGAIIVNFSKGERAGPDGGPPLLTADGTPTKMRPDQPGGIEVPHQDKLVYERLNERGAKPNVERLLPPPEEPLPRPVVTPPMPAPAALPAVPPVAQLPPPPPGATTTVPRLPGDADPSAAAQAPADNPLPGAAPSVAPAVAPPPATAAKSAVPMPTSKPGAPPARPAQNQTAQGQAGQAHASQPAPSQPAQPHPVQTAALPAAPAKPPASVAPTPAPAPAVTGGALKPPPAQPAPATAQATPALAPASGTLALPSAKTAAAAAPAAAPKASGGGGGGWRIQLASVRSEAEASTEWKRLVGRYPQALGGVSMQVAKADLGEKGVFYRVQGAGMDEARAKAACAQLKAQNVGCVVVRP